MIVCHCNVLTDSQIRATLASEAQSMPRSPVQVHKCLGCAPDCGRCLPTIREILKEARCSLAVGCAMCPGQTPLPLANDQHALPMVMQAAE